MPQLRARVPEPTAEPGRTDYYYRDFYDGLGAEISATVFALSAETTANGPGPSPRTSNRTTGWTWAPGTGTSRLRQGDPADTVFDGLDLSAGVEEAVHHGRIRTGHRGCSPSWRPAIAGTYDVVSMHHYSNTPATRARSWTRSRWWYGRAAYAEIEMPDVASRLGRALGSWGCPGSNRNTSTSCRSATCSAPW